MRVITNVEMHQEAKTKMKKIKMGLTVVYPRKMGENYETKYSCRCFLPAASEIEITCCISMV
jgi:hypothetical protein